MLSGSLCHSPQQPIEEVYVSWRPDPFAIATDTFTMSWQEEVWYAFPPFSLIGRYLHKVRLEGCTVLVTPVWDVQPWYRVLLDLLIEYPLLLPSYSQLLVDPSPASCLETIRETHLAERISERASALIWSGWSKGTNTAYQSGWSIWCAKRQIDPISGDVQHFLEFLAGLYHQRLQHRSKTPSDLLYQ